MKKIENKNLCPKCNSTFYVNQVACASCLPIKKGKVLLSIRKHEPFKGEYDLIGGFLQPGESAEDGAIRECKEETGLDIKIIKLLGTYPDQYGKDGVYTLNIQFIVEITGGKMQAQEDVSKLVWVLIKDIPKLKLKGLKNTRETLKNLYKSYKSGDP